MTLRSHIHLLNKLSVWRGEIFENIYHFYSCDIAKRLFSRCGISMDAANRNTDISKQTNSTNGNVITEGKATVLFEKNVFYNPVQEFNRDLTIAVINQYQKDFCGPSELKSKPEVKFEILEALSATGLRSIRFAKELTGVTEIIANDVSQSAVTCIEENIRSNDVTGLVRGNCDDASLFMYKNKKRFDVVDVDPYGTAAPFLDAAVQSVRDGGLLCVTSTDASILCGNNQETCYAKYNATSLKMSAKHEMGLRILLHSIESHANRYCRHIEPLLCVSVDFYMRLYVRVYTSQQAVKRSFTKRSLVYHCTGCGSFYLHPIGRQTGENRFGAARNSPLSSSCEFCQEKFEIGGPIWSHPIQNQQFASSILDSLEPNQEQKPQQQQQQEEEEQQKPNPFHTATKMAAMLTLIKEELPNSPLHYNLDKLSAKIHTSTMKHSSFRSAILNAGYSVSSCHSNKLGFKTTAPPNIIWDILKSWEKHHSPSNRQRWADDKVSVNLLESPISSTIDFTLHTESEPPSVKSGLPRFPLNPPLWGPRNRAKMSSTPSTVLLVEGDEKGLRKQKKHKLRTEGKPGLAGVSEGCGDDDDDSDKDVSIVTHRDQKRKKKNTPYIISK